MKIKNQNLLPKMLPGTVHKQFVRCGKQNCKCKRGELHGPYYYHFTRGITGKLRKRYLKPEQVEAIQNACKAMQEIQRSIRASYQDGLQSWRELNSKLNQLNDPDQQS